MNIKTLSQTSRNMQKGSSANPIELKSSPIVIQSYFRQRQIDVSFVLSFSFVAGNHTFVGVVERSVSFDRLCNRTARLTVATARSWQASPTCHRENVSDSSTLCGGATMRPRRRLETQDFNIFKRPRAIAAAGGQGFTD